MKLYLNQVFFATSQRFFLFSLFTTNFCHQDTMAQRKGLRDYVPGEKILPSTPIRFLDCPRMDCPRMDCPWMDCPWTVPEYCPRILKEPLFVFLSVFWTVPGSFRKFFGLSPDGPKSVWEFGKKRHWPRQKVHRWIPAVSWGCGLTVGRWEIVLIGLENYEPGNGKRAMEWRWRFPDLAAKASHRGKQYDGMPEWWSGGPGKNFSTKNIQKRLTFLAIPIIIKYRR